jgi:hypothetical protein
MLTIFRYEEASGDFWPAGRTRSSGPDMPVGAAFLTRYSMSDGRLLPTEFITAAIFAVLIYSTFSHLIN